MELTKKQKEGLNIALQRYKDKERYTVIAGYAGTGKSTLVKFIISALAQQYGIDPDIDVIYTSFTGKATQVLQKKGNKNVCTLHKLLYDWAVTADGSFIKTEVKHISYKIVIVDECSMVPKSLFQTLSKHKNIYVICLGDPGQLPPINTDEDNHLLDNPHIFLDEIMRQAAESEIISLTQDIRQGKNLINKVGKEIQILNKEQLNTGMLQWADQIICATNQTRLALNNQIRKLLNKGNEPEDNDKVICLKNHWEKLSTRNEEVLINGTIGYLDKSYTTYINIAPFKTIEGSSRMPILQTDLISETGDIYKNLIIDKHYLETGVEILDWKTKVGMSRSKKYMKYVPLEFAYGYAITRSQESAVVNGIRY